jgi:transposase
MRDTRCQAELGRGRTWVRWRVTLVELHRSIAGPASVPVPLEVNDRLHIVKLERVSRARVRTRGSPGYERAQAAERFDRPASYEGSRAMTLAELHERSQDRAASQIESLEKQAWMLSAENAKA